MARIFLMAIISKFFFNRKTIFVLKQQISKEKIACKNIFFCVHNVVLDTQKLVFFSISQDNVFKTPTFYVRQSCMP